MMRRVLAYSKERWQEIEEALAVGFELLLGLQRKFLSGELTGLQEYRGATSSPDAREPLYHPPTG